MTDSSNIIANCAHCGAPIPTTHAAVWNVETGEAFCAPCERHAGRPKRVPLRATLDRLAALRERATGREWWPWEDDEVWCTDDMREWGPWEDDEVWITDDMREWLVAANVDTADRDLIVAEHNSGPRRDEMLERAREIIDDLRGDYFADGKLARCGRCYRRAPLMRDIEHEPDCAETRADAWLADYEGQSNA